VRAQSAIDKPGAGPGPAGSLPLPMEETQSEPRAQIPAHGGGSRNKWPLLASLRLRTTTGLIQNDVEHA
jgi:hypothetical protein